MVYPPESRKSSEWPKACACPACQTIGSSPRKVSCRFVRRRREKWLGPGRAEGEIRRQPDSAVRITRAIKLRKELAPQVGLEPTTLRLQLQGMPSTAFRWLPYRPGFKRVLQSLSLGRPTQSMLSRPICFQGGFQPMVSVGPFSSRTGVRMRERSRTLHNPPIRAHSEGNPPLYARRPLCIRTKGYRPRARPSGAPSGWPSMAPARPILRRPFQSPDTRSDPAGDYFHGRRQRRVRLPGGWRPNHQRRT